MLPSVADFVMRVIADTLSVKLVGGTQMSPQKYEFNSLFRKGPNWKLNAKVGANGGPYDFADYAQGFFDAGHKIVEAIKREEWRIDSLIYPAAFSYRHGIELYLKHLIR
jgi:hypothetical protein